MRRRRRQSSGGSVALGAAFLIAVLAAGGVGAADSLVSGTSPSSSTTDPASSTSSATTKASGPAASQLDGLPVKGRAPMTGYDRDQFGQAWSDDVPTSGGHNGCDQRNDVLRRDLDPVEIKAGTNGCVADGGTLTDPYSGDDLDFVRGAGTSAAVPVDHVVSLGNAWATGGQQISAAKREALANDPLNLQPTRQDLNSQKGDGDAATWLPPAKTYRCTYVARQIAVKDRYELWVTQPEKDAMEGVLSSCSTTSLDTATWDVPEVQK